MTKFCNEKKRKLLMKECYSSCKQETNGKEKSLRGRGRKRGRERKGNRDDKREGGK